MECSVENAHLRYSRKHCRNSLDTENVCRVVKRSEYRAFLELCYNFISNKLTAHELLCAMYHTVTYRLDIFKSLKYAILLIEKSRKYCLDTHSMVLDRHLLLEFFLTCRLMLQASYLQSDPLNQTLGQKIIHLITLHIKKLILE